MPLRASLLRLLHLISCGLLLLNMLLGYGAHWGLVSLGWHIPAGFASAIVLAFTHAMTMFYFVGTGVSMRDASEAGRGPSNALRDASEAGRGPSNALRDASGARGDARSLLAQAETLRSRLVWPLGLAVIALIAATVLGGGSHTYWLPRWPHAVAAWVALICGLAAHIRSARLIAGNEAVIRRLEEVLGM
jgi:hypothetical protein